MWLIKTLRCYLDLDAEVTVSILACCLGSSLTVTAVTPYAAAVRWVVLVSGLLCWPTGQLLYGLSKETQALAAGLGGGVNTIPFVPAAVSCEEREVNKASLSAWEGRLAIVVGSTQRGNSAHIGHPAHTHG